MFVHFNNLAIFAIGNVMQQNKKITHCYYACYINKLLTE